MADDMNLPGIGKLDKKYVIAGVIVAVGIGVVVYTRSRNAANAAGATAQSPSGSTDNIDPATGVPYSQESGVDPATGIPYADESGGGYGGNYGYPSNSGTGYDAAGYPLGSAADLAWQSEQSSGITTNDEWVQEAMNGSVPGSSSAVQSALAGVLGGLTVTTDQKNLFLEAVGILGDPPQGYPKPIKTSDTASHPGTSKVAVPQTTGKSAGEAHDLIIAAGLRPRATGSHQTPDMRVARTSPKAGTMVSKGSTVSIITQGYVRK